MDTRNNLRVSFQKPPLRHNKSNEYVTPANIPDSQPRRSLSTPLSPAVWLAVFPDVPVLEG